MDVFLWIFHAISEGSSIFRKLYFKVATLNWVLSSYFISLPIFSCVQRNRWLITVVFSTTACEVYLELIIYPFHLEESYAAHPCFLVRNSVKLTDKRWNFYGWNQLLWNSPYSLKEKLICYLDSSLRFLYQHS